MKKDSKALLILDMLNQFDFPEGPILAKRALPVAHRILKLKKRCQKKDIPVIYVNDNYGFWKANWRTVFNSCVIAGGATQKIAEILQPDETDFFIIKPKHSGFYCTNLEPLLAEFQIGTLIITGIAGDICVLFTAHDAHMRNFKIIVPRDCVASNTEKGDQFLIHQLETTLKVPAPSSDQIRL